MPVSPKYYSTAVVDAVFVLKHYIDEHPLSRKTVPDLLLQTTIGQNMIRNAFREIVGCTIIHYQLQKRFETAAALLSEERHTIQQVAVICGYRNRLPNFSIDFKKIHGAAPREWCKTDREKSITSREKIKSL
ncbi:helix-turn-helix domain-containing protein [Filimonas effusa]|nr:AraC family transcriptional regulator [Filimonas effusa]